MSLAVAAFSAGVTLPSHASMGNIGTTYGVMPVDVATAQSLSMFNDQVSATYYNPAYLTKDERGELTTGLLHAEQELRASNPNADGDILSNSPSQHVLIGMKTNLSSLTRFGHPVKPLNCWTLFCTKFTPPPPGACIRHEPWPEWHSHVAEAANAG
jgi:hypothetical protein